MKCYLCGSSTSHFLTKSGYQLFRCDSCGLIRTKLEKPYDQFLKEFYTDGYFTGDVHKSAYKNYQGDKKYIQRNMNKFLSHLLKFKKTGKVLDAGCAYGFFLEVAAKKGFSVYGFDPSLHAVKHAQLTHGDRVSHSTISKSSFEKKSFDAITMFDVFEHLNDPVADLQHLRQFLKDDGVIMIATGDIQSVAARILKRRWTFYIPPQHLFFFDRKTITHALNKAGFAPMAFFRIGKWLSLAYVLHLAQTSGESKAAALLQSMVSSLRMDSFPLFIPMMDNMVVVARKTTSK